MRKNSIMQFILCLLVILSAACKKRTAIDDQKIETPVITTPVNTTPLPTPAVTPSYEVGTGSGNLTIDGKSLDLSAIKLIRIKAGNYKTITIANITGTSAQPISIKNNGTVNISESMRLDALVNVVVAGDNSADITYGFNFNDISYRALTIQGRVNGLTIKGMNFSNAGDYVITSSTNSLVYTGTAETRNQNFKILNCLFDGSNMISLGGNLNKDAGEDTGLWKDVEIAYNIFQNSSPGSVCSFTNVQDYNIHNNVVNNINANNNNHNGVFFMQGNGKFHDNKLTNYQGNSIRMWLYSRGSTPATVEIYNNVCYNTRKYSGFELQEFSRNIWSGKTTYTINKVYNNTVGQMNTSKDWEGQLLDLYTLSGTLEYYNNLGFNLNYTKGAPGNMINNMSDTKIIKEENNKYFTSQSAAVGDLTNFRTLLPGLGAAL